MDEACKKWFLHSNYDGVEKFDVWEKRDAQGSLRRLWKGMRSAIQARWQQTCILPRVLLEESTSKKKSILDKATALFWDWLFPSFYIIFSNHLSRYRSYLSIHKCWVWQGFYLTWNYLDWWCWDGCSIFRLHAGRYCCNTYSFLIGWASETRRKIWKR